MPQKVANILIHLFTIPQSVAIVIKSHKLWQVVEVIMEQQIVYVKGRLESGLHKELKEIADSEKRSIVFLMNEAVKLLIENRKSAKA